METVIVADLKRSCPLSEFKKTRQFFSDPRKVIFDDIIDINNDLSFARLFEAYSWGIFPWPHKEYPVLWFSPRQRGVLDFDEFYISKSFQKILKKNPFTVTFNKDFLSVIQACAQVPRGQQTGTWITREMISSYFDFHQRGYAHSVECWSDEKLLGGIYGVFVGGVFSAESMFFLESNASKVALYHLTQKLQSLGLSWLDIQMVTPFTESIGGKYIPRDEFLLRLEQSHQLHLKGSF